MKRDGAGDVRAERNSPLWIASLAPEATVKSPPTLLLRATAGSAAMQLQHLCSCPWLITARKHGMFLVWDHVDVQRLERTGSAPHRFHLSPAEALRRAGPVPQRGSTVELVLVAKVGVSQPRGKECGMADRTTAL